MCVTRRTRACYEHWADADISFLAKGQDRLMSACSMLYGYDSLCFLGGYKPTAPARHIPYFRFKTLSISRQPTFRMACCYRRTFPPSISRMTVFNAIWKILSERLDDGSCFLFSGLLWGGWLVSTLLVFVLITSSCISRNRCVMRDTKAYHEHWADADISFLAKGQDRLMSAYTLCSMAQFYLALFLVSSPDHPPLLMGSSTMLVLLRRLSASHYPDGYGRLSPVQI